MQCICDSCGHGVKDCNNREENKGIGREIKKHTERERGREIEGER